MIKMRERVSLSDDICRKLKKQISGRKFESFAFMPSEKELMDNLSVSRNTIRSALIKLEEERMVEAVHGKGWRILGDNANIVKHKPLGIVLTGGAAQSISIMKSTTIFCEKNNLNFHFYQTSLERQGLGQILDPSQVSGILFFSGLPLAKQIIEDAKRFRLPIVCANLHSEESYDTVATDDDYAVKEAIGMLLGKGRKNFLFIGCQLPDPSFFARHESFLRIAGEGGVNQHSIILHENWISPENDAQKILDAVKDKKIDAVLCVTANIAKLALMLFTKHNIRVPGDISLTAIGDEIQPYELSFSEIKSLTCAVYDMEEICRSGVERLMSRICGDASPARLELVKPISWKVDSI